MMLLQMVYYPLKILVNCLSQASYTYTQPCMILGVFYVGFDG